jgi:hypothetical protein
MTIKPDLHGQKFPYLSEFITTVVSFMHWNPGRILTMVVSSKRLERDFILPFGKHWEPFAAPNSNICCIVVY